VQRTSMMIILAACINGDYTVQRASMVIMEFHVNQW